MLRRASRARPRRRAGARERPNPLRPGARRLPGNEADRGRLLDIARELESLWNKRRMEKASIDTAGLPDVIVHAYESDARRTRWARRRGRAKRGSDGAPREREVSV